MTRRAGFFGLAGVLAALTVASCVASGPNDPPQPVDGAQPGSTQAIEGSAVAADGSAPVPRPVADSVDFFFQSRESAISALAPAADLPVDGSVWAGDFSAFAPFAARGLSAQAMVIFRQTDAIVMDGERTFSFGLDRAPTRLQCNGLWPCVTVTAPDGTLSALRFEVVRDAATGGEVLLALDCLERDQVAGGAGFPSDEQLLVNGGLVARHRTGTHLCVRRVNAVGPRRVAVDAGGGT